jgi:hypothetical protein
MCHEYIDFLEVQDCSTKVRTFILRGASFLQDDDGLPSVYLYLLQRPTSKKPKLEDICLLGSLHATTDDFCCEACTHVMDARQLVANSICSTGSYSELGQLTEV